MKAILRIAAAALAVAAQLTTRATSPTGASACATSYYPVDFATLLEYAGSPENVSRDEPCQRFVQPGY